MSALAEHFEAGTVPSLTGRVSQPRPEILILSSSLLIDRVLLYTQFLDELNSTARVRLWAESYTDPKYRPLWNQTPGVVEDFPGVNPFKEFPYNYFRRLNEYVWDFRLNPTSRLSMDRHVRQRNQRALIRSLRLPARLLASLRLEAILENELEQWLLSYPRSPQAHQRLRENCPDVMLVTGPFQFAQPGVVAAARKAGVPILAMIPSWDNLSTKNRMVFKYDGYIVWSEQGRKELHQFYPATRHVPVYVVGAPQFDVFFEDRFHLSRQEFCQTQGLETDRPILVYAVGSPNFLKGEWHGAFDMAERIVRGELGDVQMIVRPHPLHDKGELLRTFDRFRSRVVVQQPGKSTTSPGSVDIDQTLEWVNTFRHADVVVNLSSTVMIDAALFDRPVINLNFDPGPGQPQQQLINEINHTWNHIKPVVASGGVWLVNDQQELMEAVRTYLRQPGLHSEQRRWMAEYVCQYVDGQCGKRMADAILEFIEQRRTSRA